MTTAIAPRRSRLRSRTPRARPVPAVWCAKRQPTEVRTKCPDLGCEFGSDRGLWHETVLLPCAGFFAQRAAELRLAIGIVRAGRGRFPEAPRARTGGRSAQPVISQAVLKRGRARRATRGLSTSSRRRGQAVARQSCVSWRVTAIGRPSRVASASSIWVVKRWPRTSVARLGAPRMRQSPVASRSSSTSGRSQ